MFMHAVITSQMMVSDNVFFFFPPAGTTFISGTTYLRERGEAIMSQRKKSKKKNKKKNLKDISFSPAMLKERYNRTI